MSMKAGDRVEITRINGEAVRGVILRRLDYLKHIGDFYQVGIALDPETVKRPTRGKPRPGREIREIGMYEARAMKRLQGRPMITE